MYYRRRGRINVRELHAQRNSCRRFVLVLEYVIDWRADEISSVVRSYQPANGKIDVALLGHIRPIEGANLVGI